MINKLGLISYYIQMREGAIENRSAQFEGLLARKAEGAQIDLSDSNFGVSTNAAIDLGVMSSGAPSSREAFLKMLEG